MTSLFLAYHASWRDVADRRSPISMLFTWNSVPTITVIDFPFPSAHIGAVHVRAVIVVIVGAPRHVVSGLLIVEVFGIPSAEVPSEILQFSHLRSRGVVA